MFHAGQAQRDGGETRDAFEFAPLPSTASAVTPACARQDGFANDRSGFIQMPSDDESCRRAKSRSHDDAPCAVLFLSIS